MLNKLSRIYEYLEHLKMEKDRENMVYKIAFYLIKVNEVF